MYNAEKKRAETKQWREGGLKAFQAEASFIYNAVYMYNNALYSVRVVLALTVQFIHS